MPDSTPVLVHGLPADPGPALDVLAQGWTEPERSIQRQALADSLAGGQPDDFVCVRAMAGDTLAGVVLAQKLPGRTAAVYAPQMTDACSPELTAQLLLALEQQLRQAGVRLVQALLGLDQIREDSCFQAAGYTTAATLLYMVCDAAAFPREPPQLKLNLEPVKPASEPRLGRLIEATYQGTLDCPLLNGVRTPSDVLAGYRAVGTHRPELWLLASRGSEDVGCLLLADHPQLDNLELVYLGLVPAARGKGLGLALTRHALWLAWRLKRQRVVLAVDAVNFHAIRPYEEAGFFGFDQRIVIIKEL